MNYSVYQDALNYATHTATRKETDRQPTATPHDTESSNQEVYICSFDAFWKGYPRKVGKASALKSWQKLNPDSSLKAKILKALEWQSQQPEWQKENGKFTPHPSTWLNGRRWEDEQPVQHLDMGGHYR